MATHSKCLICNSSSLSGVGNYLKGRLVKCNDCNFHFAVDIPTTEELIAHYNKYERNDYLSPITIKRYHEILDSFEPYRKTNRLIDVGCGIGYFLTEAQKRGWEVYGTEFTDEAIAICKNKGFNMQQGVLNTADYEAGSFDIVTSFEVLEHINNPIEEIQKFNNLLRKGGLLYFTTPNFNALERYYLKENYNVVSYPEHLSYYTKTTMNGFLTKHGFDKVKITTTGISLTRIETSKEKAGEKYVEENNTDDRIRNLTEEKGWAQLAKKTINAGLDLLGVGNSLKGYYIKR